MPDSDILAGELPIKLALGDAVLLRVQRVWSPNAPSHFDLYVNSFLKFIRIIFSVIWRKRK